MIDRVKKMWDLWENIVERVFINPIFVLLQLLSFRSRKVSRKKSHHMSIEYYPDLRVSNAQPSGILHERKILNTRHSILNTLWQKWEKIIGKFVDLLFDRTWRKRFISLFVIIAFGYIFLRMTSDTKAAGWWPTGGQWKMRKALTITNNSAANLSSGSTIAITIDTKSLYDAGKIQSDCDDLRILYQPNSTTVTEVTRHLIYPASTTCATSTATKVNFKLQAALNTTIINSTDYFVYYNNSGASTPSSTDDAFDTTSSINATLVCPFDGSTTCAAGETPSTEAGAIRYSGSKNTLSFDGRTDNYVTGPSMPSIFGTGFIGSFTIEGWFYFKSSLPNTADSYWMGGSYINDMVIGNLFTNYLRFRYHNSSTSGVGSYLDCHPTVQPTGQWTNVSVTYDGTTIRMFIDGVMCGSQNDSVYIDGGNSFKVGGVADYPMLADEIRISNLARYVSNYTPSTTPFVRDSNTKLLYHFDENGDDPRNSGKTIDDSGNGNHGTITGAKYVSGLVGVDSSTSDTGNVSRQSYAAHEGVFVEEGTTNKITNPSFDHGTYDTNWHQITASAQGYWRLGEASGSRADSIGSNTLTDNNTVTQASGKIGNAGQFTANNQEYLSIGDNSQLSAGDVDFSIGAWVYLDSKGPTRTIVSKDNLSDAREYSLYYDSISDTFAFEVFDGSNSIVQVQATTLGSPSTGTWYYLLAWHDASADTIYIQANNGTADSAATGGTGPGDTNEDFEIGAARGANDPFDGRIDEVGFWKRILTSNERKALYNAGSGLDPTNLTPSSNTTAPYYKFGSKSAKLIAGSNGAADFVTDINPASTATHTYSFYAYDGTSGNVGGTVSSSIIKPLFEGAAQSSGTYTDMGGGWWRVTYSAATTSASNTYGFQVPTGKTVYIDGVQLEAYSYATTYTDGTLGTGYSWSGTAHNSTSSRTATNLAYTSSGNISGTKGTLSFWVKSNPIINIWTDSQYHVFFDSASGGSDMIRYHAGVGGLQLFWGGSNIFPSTASFTINKWIHVVATWDNSANNATLYMNGSSSGSGSYSTITFGSSFKIGNTGGGQYADANISDLRIFDTALSSTQVTDLYQSGLVGHSEGSQIDRFGGGDTKGENRVATWHMDEGFGTTTYDSTVNANNLTITGPTWETTNTNASTNRRVNLKFDGSNDYVTRSTDGDFDFGTGSFSVGGWFRHPSTVSGTDTILSRYGSAGYKVYMNSSGYVCFAIDDDTTWTPDDSACTTTSYADSKWHYFSAVKSSTTSITLYIDGNSVATDSSLAATGTLNTGSPLYLGIDSDASSNPWDGYLDEFIFYNYARSAAQIKSDISGAQISASIGSQTKDPLVEGLVGYWKMDESSGNTSDSSGNGYTLTNNGTTTFVAGKYANGSEYVPASSQYLSTASTISGVKTVAFWVNPDSTTNYYASLTSGAYVTSSSGTVSATGFTTPKIYVNGIESSTVVADAWQHVVVVSDTAIDANQFYVGRQGSNYYDGTIDETRLYNRALSPGEIQQLYNFTPGPVGHWKMDEKAGTSAYDSSGNGYTGTLTLGPTWTTGKIGSAVDFDGSDDRVTTSSVLGLGTSNVTISAWVYIDSITLKGGFVKVGANGDGYSIGVGNGSHDSSGNNLILLYEGVRWIDTSTAIGTGWHYVSMTINSSGVPSAYLDGRFLASYSGTNANTPTTRTDIGGNNPASNPRFFDGKVDDVRIYNYARTGGQIIQDMNAGHPLAGSPVGSQVAYWKLDEGQGTNAYDTSINSNALTLSSATSAWTNSGKFGKAWNGDGALYMSRADDADFDFAETEDMGISAWVKSDSASNPGATEYVFNKAGATTAGYAVYFNTSGNLCFGIDDDTSWGPDIASCTTTDVYDATWHHFSAVRDYSGTDKTYIYIDGRLKDSDSDTTTATLANSLSLYVGDRDGTNNGDEFTGDIDEIKVYRAALSQADVLIDYNRGSAITLGALSDNSSYAPNAANQEYCIPGDSTSCAAPVGEWKLNERTGTSAFDGSGNSYTGTLTSGPTWAQGKIGAGLSFDGSDDYVTFGDVLDMGTSDFTTSIWFKASSSLTTDCSTGGRLFQKRGTGAAGSNAGWQFVVCKSGSDVRITNTVWDDGASHKYMISDSGSPDSAGFVIGQVGNWIHLESTIDNTNDTWKFFINGALLQSFSVSNLIGSVDNARSLTLGASDTTLSQFFSGTIDQVGLYNYVRTPAQIAWDYNRGAPVAHYKFDECSGAVANDASGNGNTGTVTIGASGTQTSAGICSSGTSTQAWNNGTSGKFNSSMNFDGTDDYVTIADSASLDITSAISVSAWVKLSSATTASVIYKDSDTNSRSWGLAISSSKIAGIVFKTGGSNTLITGNTTLSTGNWYHATMVYQYISDGTSTLDIYLNGKKDATQLTNAIGPILAGNSTIQIGAREYSSSRIFLPGQIDDVRIYNYALTSAQIKNVMNEGSAVRFGPATGNP